MTEELVDITPDPSILSILGEIEFKQSQCVAELIDNSIDGFLGATIRGTPIAKPEIRVGFGQNTITVKDNGPGMSLPELEKAVRAGWTSHDRFGSLGLYGVGFNIATARLGSLTTIWSSRSGDDQEVGLTIDLIAMRGRGHDYKLTVKRRTKTNPNTSGTTIEVTKLRPEWANLFTNANWLRPNITRPLERMYSTMLRTRNPQPLGFSLYVNNIKVVAWEYVVWPTNWTVFRKDLGEVRPFREIDVTYGQKYVSRSTGEPLESSDGLDPNDVIVVPERVYGWIGVQRYIDSTDYGIDILRNGRKIELGCKDIFMWETDAGERITEYPIDDPRFVGGRIVGEIHLNHGYVHYTKHRFERDHASWKHLLLALRGNEPLVNRERYGFTGTNDSPLGTLFRTFRRNTPQKKTQTYWDILVLKENRDAKNWANEYRKGNSPYNSDEWWEGEIRKQDKESEEDTDSERAKLSPEEITVIDGGKAPVETPSHEDGAEPTQDRGGKDNTSRTSIPELSFMNLTGLGRSGRTYNIQSFSLTRRPGAQSQPPWSSKLTERGVLEIDVDLDHPIFQSTSFGPLDAILGEVSYVIASEDQSMFGPQGASYSELMTELRRRFATSSSLDANRLRMEIMEARRLIVNALLTHLSTDEQGDLINSLPTSDADQIRLKHAQGEGATVLLEYADLRHVATFFDKTPHIFFDANCFNQSWSPQSLREHERLLTQHRDMLKSIISALLTPLAQYDLIGNGGVEDDYLQRNHVRACLNRLRALMIA